MLAALLADEAIVLAAELVLLREALTLLPALEAAADADEIAEDREAGVEVREVLALAVPLAAAVATAPGAQVAAVGRLVMPWPAQRESAKVMVAVDRSY